MEVKMYTPSTAGQLVQSYLNILQQQPMKDSSEQAHAQTIWWQQREPDRHRLISWQRDPKPLQDALGFVGTPTGESQGTYPVTVQATTKNSGQAITPTQTCTITVLPTITERTRAVATYVFQTFYEIPKNRNPISIEYDIFSIIEEPSKNRRHTTWTETSLILKQHEKAKLISWNWNSVQALLEVPIPLGSSKEIRFEYAILSFSNPKLYAVAHVYEAVDKEKECLTASHSIAVEDAGKDYVVTKERIGPTVEEVD